jgi:hypothetical protein
LQLERDEERVVVVAWLFEPPEREPGCERGGDQVGEGEMVHTDPRADPLAEPGALTVPAALSIARME